MEQAIITNIEVIGTPTGVFLKKNSILNISLKLLISRTDNGGINFITIAEVISGTLIFEDEDTGESHAMDFEGLGFDITTKIPVIDNTIQPSFAEIDFKNNTILIM